jgi:hypothetical protein
MKAQIYNTVSWKKYLIPGTSKRVDTFLEMNGKDVYQQVTDRVCNAIRNDLEKIVLVVHRHAGNAIVIYDYEYDEFLEVATDWFLKVEDYRMCGKIKNYTNMIFEKQNKNEVKKVKNLI